MIIKNFQRLDISEKSDVSFSLQNFIIIIQSFNVLSTAACESLTNAIISVNLISELIYFNLVEDELSASINDEMIFFMKDTLMLYL